MPQVFPRSANYLARGSLLLVILLPALVIGSLYAANDSSYVDREGVVREQPIPFSHKHHAGALGIDCRYCHTSVEESSYAGIPPTHTCMSCHSQVWNKTDTLEPVRESYAKGENLEWNRVHDLPDYVHFNHSIHVSKGVGCESCHGRVDKMPLVHLDNALHMSFCLDCHRNPAEHLRPRDEITTMGYEPENQQALGQRLIEEYDVNPQDHCYTCHR